MARIRKIIRVALIHGTFAPNAKWVESPSVMTEEIEKSTGRIPKFFAIRWSGRNSRAQRKMAAEKTVRHLSKSSSESGRAYFIVGHSHGGNIGVEAVHKIWPSGWRPKDLVGLVTLNTPFLIFLMRSSAIIAMQTIFIGIGVLVTIAPMMDWLDVGPVVSRILGPLLVLTFIGGVIFLGSSKAIEKKLENIRTRHEHRLHVDRHTRVLCISSRDDEAIGWLQLIDNILNFPFLILHPLALLPIFIGIPFLHYFLEWNFSNGAMSVWMFFDTLEFRSVTSFVGSFYDALKYLMIWQSEEEIQNFSSMIWETRNHVHVILLVLLSTIANFLMFWALVALVAVVGNYTISGLVFGNGFGMVALATAWVCRLKVTDVPVQFANVEYISTDPHTSLRHSSPYDDVNVAHSIGEWIRANVEDWQE